MTKTGGGEINTHENAPSAAVRGVSVVSHFSVLTITYGYVPLPSSLLDFTRAVECLCVLYTSVCVRICTCTVHYYCTSDVPRNWAAQRLAPRVEYDYNSLPSEAHVFAGAATSSFAVYSSSSIPAPGRSLADCINYVQSAATQIVGLPNNTRTRISNCWL